LPRKLELGFGRIFGIMGKDQALRVAGQASSNTLTIQLEPFVIPMRSRRIGLFDGQPVTYLTNCELWLRVQ